MSRDRRVPSTHLRVSVLGGFRLEEDGVTPPLGRTPREWDYVCPRGIPRAAMSPAASGGRIVEPVTEEDV
jgi:hypothetical protein